VRDGAAEVLRDGLAHVGERRTGAEIAQGAIRENGLRYGRRVGEDGDVFARVVGGFPARVGIAAVVGGDHQEVVASEGCEKLSELRVEFLERAGESFDVLAMAVEHVEVDEVAEDEAGWAFANRGSEFGHAIRVGTGGDVVGDAAAIVNIVNFADAKNGNVLFGEHIEQHGHGRVDGVIMAAWRAHEVAGRSGERAGDDAADAVRPLQKFAGDFTHFVKVGDGDYFFVGGNLEDAVAGSVNDGFAGADVLFAKLLDDFGAGGRLVADGFAADARFESADDFRREAVFVHRKSLIEPHAGHFPVAGSGVFAWRVRGALAVGGEGQRGGSEMRKRHDVGEAERDQRGNFERARFRDVAECGAAYVVVVGGVGESADADAVEDDPDDALEFVGALRHERNVAQERGDDVSRHGELTSKA